MRLNLCVDCGFTTENLNRVHRHKMQMTTKKRIDAATGSIQLGTTT